MDLTPVVSSSVSLYFCVSLSHSLWCFETRMDSHSLWTPRMWPLGSLSWWITHKGWMVNYPAALNPQVNIFSSLSVYVCTRAFWTVLSLNTPLLWPQRERSGVVYEEFWSFKSSFCWRSNENVQPAVGIWDILLQRVIIIQLVVLAVLLLFCLFCSLWFCLRETDG